MYREICVTSQNPTLAIRSFSSYQVCPPNAQKLPWLDCSLKAPGISEKKVEASSFTHIHTVSWGILWLDTIYLQALVRNPKSCGQDLIIKSLDFKSGSAMMETN